MGKMLKVMFISFTLFVFSATIARPQDRSKTEDAAFEADIQIEIAGMKEGGYDDKITQYLALRKEDPFLCHEEKSQQEVKNVLLPVRYFAEGKCEKIMNPFIRKVCDAERTGGCGQLSGLQRDYCQAFSSGNIVPLARHYKKLAKILYGENEANLAAFKALLLHDAGIYSGYKDFRGGPACKKYIDQISTTNRVAPLYIKLACDILFYSDPAATVDHLMRDIALFSLSRNKRNKDVCRRINNPDIKKACHSAAFRKVDDLFHSR